ncbi:GTPase Era [Henriciella algicola]|jgi:GTPase|uniref:GTPase Era n=1 Tax=Henriciella algicola TaxID=1608422 RepID=A0A399RF27_9PROT|nr:GTPase Era [Henriciella algicola]QYJ00188.1 GTPase Era [Thalassovita mediterranea]RIJ29074.1 GTPase Era [Henriciella algicola]
MQADDINRAGFVAIIGAPNAGKSTLTNAMVGTKVAIVTHKVQTTRFPVRGVAHSGDAQLVIVDTPGIFGAKKRLDRAMVKSAWTGAEDADAVVHLIDAAAWIADRKGKAAPAQTKSVEDDRDVIRTLKRNNRKVILALNKIDLFPHDEVLPLIAQFNEEGAYSDIFMISAENGDGLDLLMDHLAAQMPEGPAMFPPDQSADIPMRLLAAEITREKLMLRLHEELPYQLTVETETWEDFKNGDVRIEQAVIVGRDNHKSMVLGKNGQTIKWVSRAAREELGKLLDTRVHLFLFVKVDEKWQEKRESYAHLGLEFDS